MTRVINLIHPFTNLRSSAPGTAKHEVYKARIENNEDVWYSSLEVAKEAVLSEPNTYLYAHDSSARGHPGKALLRKIDTVFRSYCDTIGTRENHHSKQMSLYAIFLQYKSAILDLYG